MFGFLRRAIGIAGAYSAGKGYEKAYNLAQLSTIIYLDKLGKWADVERNALWSYLFCTEPRDPIIVDFCRQWKDEIADSATQLLDADEPFREVVVSSLWIALAVTRSQNDRTGFDRVLPSGIFKQYSTAYQMLPHDKYSALVERWSRRYSPVPSADDRS
jgi:hypothetical protein